MHYGFQRRLHHPSEANCLQCVFADMGHTADINDIDLAFHQWLQRDLGMWTYDHPREASQLRLTGFIKGDKYDDALAQLVLADMLKTGHLTSFDVAGKVTGTIKSKE